MLVSLLPLVILVHNQDQEALSLIPECKIQVKNMPQLHDSLKTVLPYFKGVKNGWQMSQNMLLPTDLQIIGVRQWSLGGAVWI